jgi:hypothetical protein
MWTELCYDGEVARLSEVAQETPLVLRGYILPVTQTPLDQHKAEWIAWRCE